MLSLELSIFYYFQVIYNMIMNDHKISAIIIDDEKDAIEVLISLLKECCSEVHILDVASSFEAGQQLLNTTRTDIVFLDIQMPGGSGFDLLRSVDSKLFHTIFISAHENHAVKAVKFHAMAYLLKPIGLLELREAVDIVKEKMAEKIMVDYNAILQNLYSIVPHRIAIPTGKGDRYCDVKDIIRIEAAKNYSNIYINESAKPILVSKNLKHFENILSKYGFIRVHNTHLINQTHIKEYIRQDGGSIVLSDKSIIYIGRHYRQNVVKVLQSISEEI